MGWIEDAFRWIMFCLDKIVYSVIGMLYELFMTISNIAVIGQDTISEFTQRIYILIGIFMIFKITISMISWYANPDSISDSKSGSGALIKRIVISLVCLAIVPWIFTFAYRIQYVILHENIIGNLVLAGMTTTDPNEAIKNGGNIMAIRTFQGFFYPNNYVAGSDYDTAMSSTSWSSASKFIHENINTKDNGEYRYHYQAFVSTLAGGFVAWILLIFCIDIAIRSVKLAFLQLIAPIPVLSYIDQKKGDKIFNNWVSECTKTYLDVFARLIAIYFGIFLITEVCANFTNGGLGFNEYGPDGNIIAGSKSGDFFAQTFIIIVILMFVSQLPKLVGDILGIKMGSGFTLNPLKKIGAAPLAASTVSAVGGSALSLAANTISGIKNKKGFFKTLGSAVAGGFSGGFNAALDASNGKGNLISSINKGASTSSANRNLREKGYGTWQKTVNWWNEVSGEEYSTQASKSIKNQLNNLQQVKLNLEFDEKSLRDAFAEGIKNSVDPQYIRSLFKIDESTGNRTFDIEKFNKALTSDNIEERRKAESVMIDVKNLVSINDEIISVDKKSQSVNKQIKQLEEDKTALKGNKNKK